MCVLTSGRSSECLSHFRHVDDDGLDAVALALDLGTDARHLVPVEGIRHIPVDVHRPHGDGWLQPRATPGEWSARCLLQIITYLYQYSSVV